MKTKVLYSMIAVLTLTLVFTVYASLGTQNVAASSSADECCAMKDCCKDGKCSMNNGGKCNCSAKKDGHAAGHKCGADCCKDGKCSMSPDGKCKCNGGESCQMKDGKAMAGMNHADCCKDGKCQMKGEHKCPESCCKDGKCSMSADGKCKCGEHHKATAAKKKTAKAKTVKATAKTKKN